MTAFPPRPTATQVLRALIARLVVGMLGALPLDRASALGGWLGRTVGPRLAVTRIARRNLARAFPERTPAEIEAIVRGMWDHLGRVVGEYPHLGEFDLYANDGRVEVIGAELIDQVRDDGVGGILFSAHLGNWEILSLVATQNGVPLVHIYRAPNNPLIEDLIRRLRAPIGGVHHGKGRGGAKELIKALKRGEHLAMLVDQKLNDGIPVPFFGRDAMTAPALAKLALKFRCPVLPFWIERLEGAHFRLTVLPPMTLPDTGDRHADTQSLMGDVNALIEGWIRARPEQWLWVHRRWPD